MKFTKSTRFGMVLLATLIMVSSVASGDASNLFLKDRSELLGAQDTTLPTGFFHEHVEMMAGEGDAIITQVGFFGGTVTVPYDLSATEFNNLITFVFVVSEQDDWDRYWIGPVWEFRDGATLFLVFEGESYANAISHGNTIAEAVSSEFNLNLEPLFGAYIAAKQQSTLVYYDAMSGPEFDTYFTNWGGSPYSDGLAPFAGTPVQKAPVRAVGDVLAYDDQKSEWLPWSAAAYIVPEAITIINGTYDTYNFSMFDAYGITPIKGAASADYSGVQLRLPYVANVYRVDPETDNLFPEVTGNFDWTLKAGVFINKQHDDIQIEYDLNTTELTTYPQIQADYSVDKSELDAGTLNYTLSLENVGNEEAKNIDFAIPLGKRPENFTIPAFKTDVYDFNNSRVVYWDYEDGNMTETDPFLTLNFTIIGWFEYQDNSSIVQPVTFENLTSGNYELDWEATIAMVHENVTFFILKHSDNLAEVDDITHGEKLIPEFGLEGHFDTLAPNNSVTIWYGIDGIPSNETLLFFEPEFTLQEELHWEVELNGTLTTFRDFIIEDAVRRGEDLRIPVKPGLLEWIPGIMFTYDDIAERDYFGWSNGLGLQLYDDEAILKSTVTTDKILYRVGDDVNVTVTVENIGDTAATDVEIICWHAFMRPGWQVGDLIEFHRSLIGDIDPGQTKSTEFIGKADTFLGIHPVFASVDYTTDEGQTTNETAPFNEFRYNNIMSNLINAIVLPPVEKDGEDEPSFPTPELNVTAEILGDGNLEVGDEIEVKVTMTNVGDEPTNIIAISYFANKYLELQRNAYSVGTVRITDANDTELNPNTDYDQGFLDDDDFGITYVAAASLHLEPNDTIHMYYTVKTTAAGVFTVPPVVVEYDSRYPIQQTQGTEGENPEEQTVVRLTSKSPALTLRGLSRTSAPTFRPLSEETDEGRSWSSYSQALLGTITGEPTSSEPESKGSETTPGFVFVAIFVVLPTLGMLNWRRRRKNY